MTAVAIAKQELLAQSSVLGAVALGVACLEPGELSLHAVLNLPLAGAPWGIAAAAIGLVVAAVQLGLRRAPEPAG